MSNSAFNVGGGSSGGTLTSVGLTSDSLVVTSSPVSGASGTMNIELPESVAGANMALNGNFQIMQRGTLTGGLMQMVIPASSSGVYTFDRFQFTTNANQQFTLIQYNEVGRPSGSYQGLFRRDAGQTGTGTVQIAMSLPRSFCRGAADRAITYSVQLAAGPDFSPVNGAVTVSIVSGTGTTDTSVLSGWTGQTTEATGTLNVNGAFNPLIITTPVLGATVSQLAMILEFTPTGTAGADDSLSIANWKLELGTKATPFPRDVGTEIISQCQAFACKSYNMTTAPGTPATAPGYMYNAWTPSVSQRAVSVTFPTTMFQIPTVTTYSPLSGTSGKVSIQGNSLDVDSFVTGAGQFGFSFGSNDATPTNDMACHFFADAELY